MSTGETRGSNIDRYLQFDLGGESYALHLLKVKEVISIPETTKLPNGPAYFVGIMNLRGQIISVIDMRKKLKIEAKKNLQEAVIIVDFEDVSIGLIVDSINRVLAIEADKIAEVPEVDTHVNAAFIQGIYNHDNRLTLLIDIESVLDINHIKEMAKKAS